MLEKTPICPKCGVKMRNLGWREKQIVTLLGSCDYSRNYYGCECNMQKERLYKMLESGVIEAACKNVIGNRLKQSGMMWILAGANKMAALRCAVMSGEFEPKPQTTA